MRHPLVSVFGGSRALVLEHLLEIDAPLTVRQVARLTGLAATTASCALRSLDEVGLLDRVDVAQSQLYRLNGSHLLVEPLRGLLERARQIDATVASAIVETMRGVVAVWLYGSRARGDEVPGSDIDLLVLFDTAAEAERADDEKVEQVARLSELLGQEVSLTCLAIPGERERADSFIRAVTDEAVALFGPAPAELRAWPVEGSQARPSGADAA